MGNTAAAIPGSVSRFRHGDVLVKVRNHSTAIVRRIGLGTQSRTDRSPERTAPVDIPLVELDWREFGHRLRDARRRQGLTQEQAARAAGLSHRTWVRLENGQRRQFAAEHAFSAAAAVGISARLAASILFPSEEEGIGRQHLAQIEAVLDAAAELVKAAPEHSALPLELSRSLLHTARTWTLENTPHGG